MMMQDKLRSIHPFVPFVFENATKLIIGTIPPPRFCKEPQNLNNDDVNFYYGSRDNSFWNLLEEVFNVKFEYKNNLYAIEQRKELLKKLQIGITDIVLDCIHINNSAADKDLDEIVHKDLKGLIGQNPNIKTLIYTSGFVKKEVNKHFSTYHSINATNRKKQTIKIDGKLYDVRILYSPSPYALFNLGKNGKEKRKEQYREILLEA